MSEKMGGEFTTGNEEQVTDRQQQVVLEADKIQELIKEKIPFLDSEVKKLREGIEDILRNADDNVENTGKNLCSLIDDFSDNPEELTEILSDLKSPAKQLDKENFSELIKNTSLLKDDPEIAEDFARDCSYFCSLIKDKQAAGEISKTMFLYARQEKINSVLIELIESNLDESEPLIAISKTLREYKDHPDVAEKIALRFLWYIEQSLYEERGEEALRWADGFSEDEVKQTIYSYREKPEVVMEGVIHMLTGDAMDEGKADLLFTAECYRDKEVQKIFDLFQGREDYLQAQLARTIGIVAGDKKDKKAVIKVVKDIADMKDKSDKFIFGKLLDITVELSEKKIKEEGLDQH